MQEAAGTELQGEAGREQPCPSLQLSQLLLVSEHEDGGFHTPQLYFWICLWLLEQPVEGVSGPRTCVQEAFKFYTHVGHLQVKDKV